MHLLGHLWRRNKESIFPDANSEKICLPQDVYAMREYTLWCRSISMGIKKGKYVMGERHAPASLRSPGKQH
jgi:hypothetical protein